MQLAESQAHTCPDSPHHLTALRLLTPLSEPERLFATSITPVYIV